MRLPTFSSKRKNKLLTIRRVCGESMAPGLLPDTVVIAIGCIGSPRPGDIVLLRHNGIDKIKRVAAAEDGKIYVLGDNVSCSTDSRQYGWLPAATIIAKVIYPLTKGYSRPGLPPKLS